MTEDTNYLKRTALALERIATCLEAIQADDTKTHVVENSVPTVGAPVPTPEAETPAAKLGSVKTPPTKTEAPPSPPALDTVIKGLMNYMESNGRDAAIALLKKYKANKASDIPEDQRASFLAEISG